MTSPGLAWQADLKMTDVKLDLFEEYGMHLFIEKGIRGGVSMISTARPTFRDVQTIILQRRTAIYFIWTPIIYMVGPCHNALRVGDFRWEDPEETSLASILNQPDDAPEGFILEVVLVYPAELHDLHKGYPLAPERFNIKPGMLSPTAKCILEEMHMRPSPSSEKLVPNLHAKTNYVLHYRNLKLYLSLGLKLKKIHRILKFTQSAWLQNYIDFNTEHRKQCKTSFEKDFFKLLNNAVYGKTMKNLRNRVDVQLVNTTKKAKKLIAFSSLSCIHYIRRKPCCHSA